MKKLLILAVVIALLAIACSGEPAQGEGILTDAPAEVAPPPSDTTVRENTSTPRGEHQTALRDREQSEDSVIQQESADSEVTFSPSPPSLLSDNERAELETQLADARLVVDMVIECSDGHVVDPIALGGTAADALPRDSRAFDAGATSLHGRETGGGGQLIRIAAVFLAALVVVVTTSTASADRPETCASEDRVIPGNTNSECKWDSNFSNATSLEFVVVEESSSCYGAFRLNGIDVEADTREDSRFQVGLSETATHAPSIGHFSWGNTVEFPSNPEYPKYLNTPTWFVGSEEVTLGSSYITLKVTSSYNVTSRVNDIFHLLNPAHYLAFYHSLGDESSIDNWTPRFVMPSEVFSWADLINHCLAQVKIKQEATDEAQRQEEAELAAVLEAETKAAQAEAERLAALKQAEADAAVDAINKQSAETQLEIIREAERVKTQALRDQLARQLVISEILADIVRVRSSYAEQRSVITNQSLKARAEASARIGGRGGKI